MTRNFWRQLWLTLSMKLYQIYETVHREERPAFDQLAAQSTSLSCRNWDLETRKLSKIFHRMMVCLEFAKELLNHGRCMKTRIVFWLRMWPAIFARIIHYEGIKHLKVLRKAFTEIYRQVKLGTNKEL
uniref:Uncharacterized protein n=1 Tax=Megaselia scalaris TaxID=36166 RepID=T1GSA7_MEGSC